MRSAPPATGGEAWAVAPARWDSLRHGVDATGEPVTAQTVTRFHFGIPSALDATLKSQVPCIQLAKACDRWLSASPQRLSVVTTTMLREGAIESAAAIVGEGRLDSASPFWPLCHCCHRHDDDPR